MFAFTSTSRTNAPQYKQILFKAHLAACFFSSLNSIRSVNQFTKVISGFVSDH